MQDMGEGGFAYMLEDRDTQAIMSKAAEAANAVLSDHGLKLSEMTIQAADNSGDLGAYSKLCVSWKGITVCIER